MALSAGRMTMAQGVLSFCLILVALVALTAADTSTIERIKKHQEWLKQRNQQKTFAPPATIYKKSFELANLWRFDKQSEAQRNDPSLNDVFPESETITMKPTTTTTTTVSSPTSTTTPASITTTIESLASTPSLEEAITEASIVRGTTIETTKTKTTTPEIMVSTMVPTTKPTKATTTTTTTTTTMPITTKSTTTTTMPTTTKQPPTIPKRPKQRPYPRWGNWSKWSACSRSCGGGVMWQQRKCISRHGSTGKRFISNDCIGVYRRYHLCNDQPCPQSEEADFRAVQCSAFDDVDFQGRTYSWEPYIKEDAECELNCKPVGMKYFATLNASVIDGTPCSRPAEYYRSNYRDRAMCVGGICKAIHASGLITGLSANSGSVACGGLICRPITGIFTRDPLPEDAYVHVATIPAGASNISITELKNSINLLVLRTSEQRYIFNGDNSESESGAYEAAGAIFDYHRIDGLQHGEGVTEWITCTGPIRDTLELMVYSKAVNPGVKYEYLLPIASDSEENELSVESDGFLKAAPEENSISASRSTSRRRKYNWKVIGFGTCSKSCGGGTQTPIVRCVRENPVRYYSQRRCGHSEKPVLNENLLRCNTQPCPAYWRLDDWAECRCHQGEGYREREVSCVQELASGIVIHVDSAACLEEEPPARKPCDCPKSRRRSHSRYRTTHMANGTSSSSSASSGRHRDKAGVWLMSEWNQYCSAECGSGVEYRTIFCDRSKPNVERCDVRSTPEISRPCERERNCETGDWFAGPWNPCNGNCFNLTRSRQVLCIQNQLIVDDEDCRPELRPQSLEKCLHEEVEYCAPRWHYSEWTECTKSCDGGTQRRSVKCLEYDERENTLRDSTKCRYSLREPIYRSCNTHKCDEPRLELLQNDVAPTCVDDFSNCQWAVKAKLCSYEYYQQNCCYSCGMGDA